MGGEPWVHHNPTRIVFGRGTLAALPRHVNGRALIVTSAGATSRGLTERVLGLIGSATVDDNVQPNPTQDSVDEMIDRHRGDRIESIVAVGGGSVLDSAKVAAVLLAAPERTLRDLLRQPQDFREVDPVPVVAVPTTAGTGAEVTPTATIWDPEAKRKLSAATPRMFPKVAIVDPDLTDGLPWPETLSTGLDALSQCYESICSQASTPGSASLAEHGLTLIPPALRALRSREFGDDPRAAMAKGALLSGLAISETRTGLAHSMSYPVTAHLGVPHGLACALFLPGVLAFNSAADDGRLARVAARLGVGEAVGLAPALLEMYRELGVPDAIRARVPDVAALRALTEEMVAPGRADLNMRAVGEGNIGQIVDHTAGWLEAAS